METYIYATKFFLKKNKKYILNFNYLLLLDLVIIAVPLLTYPYLINSIGKKLFGWVLISQIGASYISIFVEFGFQQITMRAISFNRNNKNTLSEIVNSVLIVRFIFFITSGIIYYILLYQLNIFIEHKLLFYSAFFLVTNELLLPRFYFLGLERMKWVTIINVIARLISLILLFFFIKNPVDYYKVPIINSLGFAVGGFFALYIIYVKDGIRFYVPGYRQVFKYVNEAIPYFFTNLVASVKDKVSYLLLGAFVSISDVVVYDLGIKLLSLIVKPVSALSIVLFPKIALERNIELINKIIIRSFYFLVALSLITYFMMPFITNFMLGNLIEITNLRIFLLAPIFLGISSFLGSNVLVAFGKNNYMFYSILITTTVYILLCGLAYYFDQLNSLLVFILISIITYFSELIFRLYVYLKRI